MPKLFFALISLPIFFYSFESFDEEISTPDWQESTKSYRFITSENINRICIRSIGSQLKRQSLFILATSCNKNEGRIALLFNDVCFGFCYLCNIVVTNIENCFYKLIKNVINLNVVNGTMSRYTFFRNFCPFYCIFFNMKTLILSKS